jgi:acyl-CoA reductase-like NAD-dependent aldehyde dehydrogenase
VVFSSGNGVIGEAFNNMAILEAQQANIEVRNPRTGDLLYTVEEPDAAEIAAIHERARAASARVAALSLTERAACLERLSAAILQRKEAIVDRVVAETGKSRTDALVSEIFTACDMLHHYAKVGPKQLREEKVPTPLLLMGKKGIIQYEPLGVILIISPWNYPFALAFAPFAGAFMAGNAVLYKPSEWTPLQGLVEEIVAEAALPEHAFQVVYGGRDTGRMLIDGRPDKVSFTGSARGGREVAAQAAQYLIPVDLELGGKDPAIVFDDVNLTRTVAGILWGGLTNGGQSCTSVERLFVQRGIHDEFIAALKAGMEALTFASGPGDGADPASLDVGGITPDFQIGIIHAQVEDARAKGATVLVGGELVEGTRAYPPTLVVGCKPGMTLWDEETFGPVIAAASFETEDEVIAAANDTPYGLTASVWSTDLERARRVANALKVGGVSINGVMATEAHPDLPFGGVKESGHGRYRGKHGLHGYCNIKSVLIDKQSKKIEANWYPYTGEKYRLFTRLLDAAFGAHGIGGLVKTALSGMKLESFSQKPRP